MREEAKKTRRFIFLLLGFAQDKSFDTIFDQSLIEIDQDSLVQVRDAPQWQRR